MESKIMDKNYNSGNYNSGYYNSGYYNSGNCNSGYYNSGNCNSGYYNSGNCNSGNCNSGNHNSGNYNSGHYNSSNGYVNHFCNINRVFLFNKEVDKNFIPNIPSLDFPTDTFISSSDMTHQEKIDHPYHTIVGGFIRKCTLSYKEKWAFVWDKLSQSDKQKFLDLPNFDADIFFDITGIRTEQKSNDEEIIKEIEELENRLAELKKKISKH